MTKNGRKSGLWPLLLIAALLTIAVVWRRGDRIAVDAAPLPSLMAEGWLNADRPPDVSGKVVVLDAWFLGCPPCRKSMPLLAEVYGRLREEPDFALVGLTFDPASSRPEVESFVQSVDGFDWPVGYGASPTLDALGVTMYPTLILYDRTGAAVWSGHSIEGLEARIRALL